MLKIARMLIARQLAAQIMQARALFPAVVLIGPRQVGKTTLARQIAQELGGKSIYLDLERPADLLQLRDEAGCLIIPIPSAARCLPVASRLQ